jgi:Polyketide cyclase / dehydrase and lipid transport
MINVEKSIFINKTPADVFAFVTAEGNYTKFQAAVVEVIEGGPRNTVGSQFTEVRKFMGQDMRTTLEITAFEPNAKWAAKVIKGPVPYEVTVTYEASDGGTKYTTKVVGEPRGFFKLAEGVVASQLEKSLAEDGQKLKELLEKG